jgi:hypothetical protein
MSNAMLELSPDTANHECDVGVDSEASLRAPRG